MKKKEFLEATATTQWATIDELVEKLDRAGFWDDEFSSRALLDRKKAYARSAIRSMKDENGWKIFANVVTQDESGQEKHVYKQETLFDITDYRQTVNYHVATGQHHIRMAVGYRNHAFRRYDVQIPLPLGFEDAAEDGLD